MASRVTALLPLPPVQSLILPQGLYTQLRFSQRGREQMRRSLAIEPDDRGGGGYGDALERDPDHVLNDVIDEKISLTSAFEEYGVVLTDRKTIDRDATLQRRRMLRGEGH